MTDKFIALYYDDTYSITLNNAAVQVANAFNYPVTPYYSAKNYPRFAHQMFMQQNKQILLPVLNWLYKHD